LLTVLLGSASAGASSKGASPDPAPQPAPASGTSTPSPDPAPQAASSSSSRSSSRAQTSYSKTTPSLGPAEQQPQAGVAAPKIASAQTGAVPSTAPTGIATSGSHVGRRSNRRAHAAKHDIGGRLLAGRAQAAALRRGPEPDEVQSVLTSSAPTPRRGGLVLLLGALGLLALVLAGGSTLRALVRMEARFRVG
jgi:hypothetical protein